MIFSRRRIQEALRNLPSIPPDELHRLTGRLNRANADALSAMWEVMLLHHLSAFGRVEHHRTTPSGSHPDVFFKSRLLTFTADISCVSDDGIQEKNPINLLRDEIERQKRSLGLGVGGVELEVGHVESDLKPTLKLPAAKNIPDFVRLEILPAIAAAQARGEWPIILRWDTPEIEFRLTLNDGPNNLSSSRAYDIPKVLKSNPLYNRLRGKTSQVAEGEGLRGLILCDSGYSAFTESLFDSGRIDARKIAKGFLSDSPDVDFVVLFWIFEDRSWARGLRRELRCDVLQKSADPALQALFEACAGRMPRPLRTGQNALNHLRRWGMDLGFGGGSTLSWPTVRLSSKLLLHVLSGRISVAEFNERLDWRGAGQDDRSRVLNAFEQALQGGVMPAAIRVVTGPDQDDDWIEIDFEPDTALAPFRADE